MVAIINIATGSGMHAGKRSGGQKNSRRCFLFKYPSVLRRYPRGCHWIPVVIQGDTVSHILSALEGDLFSRQRGNKAMPCVVLVLRLVCGDPIILGVSRIAVVPAGVIH